MYIVLFYASNKRVILLMLLQPDGYRGFETGLTAVQGCEFDGLTLKTAHFKGLIWFWKT